MGMKSHSLLANSLLFSILDQISTMIITLAGHQGSGKSTLAASLAAHYSLKKYSAGGLLREIASSRGQTILEISKDAETDGGVIDFMLEERTRELGEKEDNFVMDGRLPWYVIPHSCKIFLTVSPELAVDRIL